MSCTKTSSAAKANSHLVHKDATIAALSNAPKLVGAKASDAITNGAILECLLSLGRGVGRSQAACGSGAVASLNAQLGRRVPDLLLIVNVEAAGVGVNLGEMVSQVLVELVLMLADVLPNLFIGQLAEVDDSAVGRVRAGDTVIGEVDVAVAICGHVEGHDGE